MPYKVTKMIVLIVFYFTLLFSFAFADDGLAITPQAQTVDKQCYTATMNANKSAIRADYIKMRDFCSHAAEEFSKIARSKAFANANFTAQNETCAYEMRDLYNQGIAMLVLKQAIDGYATMKVANDFSKKSIQVMGKPKYASDQKAYDMYQEIINGFSVIEAKLGISD